MNEEGNGAGALQVQGQNAPQPAKPTSAVNASFDASKIGLGKKRKPEKVKKVKEKKDKEAKKINQSPQNGSRERTKRPLWFWIVLGVLGALVIIAVVWAIVTFFTGLSGKSDIPTELILDEGSANESGGPSDTPVLDYMSQLQQIYESNSERSPDDSGAGSQGISAVVENTLKTAAGQRQKNEIRLAEMMTLNQAADYDKMADLINEIEVESLTLRDQVSYYAVLYMYYEYIGDDDKAMQVFMLRDDKVNELCDKQECMQ